MRPISDLTRRVEPFQVISDYVPAGDQPTAIADLVARLAKGEQDVVLLGATGTGKSATTAWLIEQVQRPTLVIAPNKTLAAQLANEFKELLPNNAVEYFVSYYDYYHHESQRHPHRHQPTSTPTTRGPHRTQPRTAQQHPTHHTTPMTPPTTTNRRPQVALTHLQPPTAHTLPGVPYTQPPLQPSSHLTSLNSATNPSSHAGETTTRRACMRCKKQSPHTPAT